MRKYVNMIFLIISIIALFVLVAKIDILPSIGDVDSAPAMHVSKYYIENAVKDTNSPNMVTAMIVDYRAFDTMFETTVMFLAGIGVIMINFTNVPYTIHDGDRIAQMICVKYERVNLIEVNSLEKTERGIGGFGHTGK